MGDDPYYFIAIWADAHIPTSNNSSTMKMTIEIPEDVLAELMQLTGHQTKRDAVEFALREAARRAKWRRVWSEGLGMTPDELAADGAPKPADLIDAPDIDEEAVQRAVESLAKRRARRAKLAASGNSLNEPPSPYGEKRP
jgi:Arc/MetJ family transcription regulator